MYRALFQHTQAKSPLYDNDASAAECGNTVIPVSCQLPDATFGDDPSEWLVGIGLLNAAGTDVNYVLFAGDAIQYGPDVSMGVIQQIQWGSCASADLFEGQTFSSASVKVTVKKLQKDSVDPHYASSPNISARPTVVTADKIQAQLHVLSRQQALAAFPNGPDHSCFGTHLVIGYDDNTMEHIVGPGNCTWERTACLCLKLNEDQRLASAICRCCNPVTWTTWSPCTAQSVC